MIRYKYLVMVKNYIQFLEKLQKIFIKYFFINIININSYPNIMYNKLFKHIHQ
jgi:hypothetical protein